MDGLTLRPILTPLIGAALCLALMPHPGATGRTSAVLEQFAAKAVSISGARDAGRVAIYIERWSTDGELDSLRQTLMRKDPSQLLPALQQHRHRAGVLLMPGIQAHGARARGRTPKNLLFAREVDTPTGRHVIAASDERLGLGEDPLEARREIAEFNLVDIRIASDGTGVGKVVAAGDVAYSPATKNLEIRNYAQQPVRLIDVRVEKP